MPTYEYRCTACNDRFDKIRPVSESGADAECPACGSAAKRAFSPVGVVFKGSGFHNTDYRPQNRETASSPASGSSTSSPESTPCPAPSESSGCAGCPKAESS